MREQLSRRLDNRLSAGELAALEAHLAECPPCRRLAARLEEVDRLFRTAPPVAPPRDLTATILQAIASPREQHVLGLTLAVAGLLAATPSLLLVAGILTIAFWFVQPDVVFRGITFLMEGIGQFYAFIMVGRLLLDLSGPWVVSGLSAAFGIGAFGLTYGWGQRVMRSATRSVPPSVSLA
jgi:predicted anti-sigma-YlaC factor YlaD